MPTFDRNPYLSIMVSRLQDCSGLAGFGGPILYNAPTLFNHVDVANKKGAQGAFFVALKRSRQPSSCSMATLSSLSSAAVASIRLRLNSSTGRPCTMLYLPPEQVTGKEYIMPFSMP